MVIGHLNKTSRGLKKVSRVLNVLDQAHWFERLSSPLNSSLKLVRCFVDVTTLASHPTGLICTLFISLDLLPRYFGPSCRYQQAPPTVSMPTVTTTSSTDSTSTRFPYPGFNSYTSPINWRLQRSQRQYQQYYNNPYYKTWFQNSMMGRDFNSYRHQWQHFEKFRGNPPNPGGAYNRRGGSQEKLNSIFDLIPFCKPLVKYVVLLLFFAMIALFFSILLCAPPPILTLFVPPNPIVG